MRRLLILLTFAVAVGYSAGAAGDCSKRITVYYDVSGTMMNGPFNTIAAAVDGFLHAQAAKDDQFSVFAFASTLDKVEVDLGKTRPGEVLAAVRDKGGDRRRTRLDLVLRDIADKAASSNDSQLFIIASDFAHDPQKNLSKDRRINDFDEAVRGFPREARARFAAEGNARLALIFIDPAAGDDNDVAKGVRELIRKSGLKPKFSDGSGNITLAGALRVTLGISPHGASVVGPHDRKLVLDLKNDSPWTVAVEHVKVTGGKLTIDQQVSATRVGGCTAAPLSVESPAFDEWSSADVHVEVSGDGVGGNATFPFEGLLLKSADRQFFPSAWTRGGSLLTEFTYYAAKAGKIEATMSGDGIAQPTRFEMPTKPGTNRVVLRVSSDSDVQTAQVSSTFAIRPEDTGGSPQPGDVYVEGSDQPSPPDHVKVVKGEHKEPGVVAGMHNYSFLLVLGILAADVLLFRRKLAPHGWVALIAHLHEANVFTATIGRILGALFPAIVAVVASIDPFAMLWGTARGAALRVIALTLIAVIFLLRKIIILLWKPASDSEVNAEESHRKVLFLYLFFCLFCAGGAVWSWYEGGLLRENAPLIRGTVVTDATTAGGPHSAESAQ